MEETVILEFKVDQAEAQKQLEKTEKALLDLKEEQKELSKAYKEGAVSQDKYVKENLRLQNSIKKENDQKRTLVKTLGAENNSRNALRLQISKLVKEYDNLDQSTEEAVKSAAKLEKEISDLTAKLTKGDKAAGLFKNQIGNYPEQLAQAAESVNVAGFSIGDITKKLSSFLNPATAAVGVIAAIGAAYANSAVGARDLAKAQNLIAAGISVVSNDLGRLVSPDSGDGILTQVVKGYGDYLKTIVNISTYGAFGDYLDGVADRTNRIAEAQERLNELTISRAFAQGFAKDDERRAELLRRIRDDEEKSVKERLEASKQIDEILERSGQRSKVVIQSQIAAIKESTEGYENNRAAQLEVANLTAEIADKEEEITGKLTENVTARKNIIAAQKKQVEETLKATKFKPPQPSGDVSFSDDPQATVPVIPLPTDEELERAEEQMKTAEDASAESFKRRAQQHSDYLDFIRNQDDNYTQFLAQQEQQRLGIISSSISTIASLFDEQSEEFRILSTGQALVNTYAAATAALAPPPIGAGPILGPAFAALAIAQGFANVARINGVEFADGGYTGNGGKYEPKGVVHGNEFVIPSETVNKYGGPQYFNKYLPGYADGGFVANQNTQPAQQALIMANALKNLPPTEISVVEVTRVQNRVRVRENLSKLG